MNGVAMSALNDYIKKLEKNLVGVDDEKRSAILRDIKIQIVNTGKEYGGGEEGIKKAIEELDPPEVLAKRYLSIYGLGYRDMLLISGIALLLSTLSLSIIPFTTWQNLSSLLFLPLLGLFIIFVGINWGLKAALVPALLSALWRSSIFQITLYLNPFEINATENGIYIVHITSLLLVLMVFIFPIPGKE